MDPREDADGRHQDAGDAPESAARTSREHRRRPRWPEVTWLAILAAIGVVQIVRAQWFDAAVFLLAVTALTVDSFGLLPAASTHRRMPLRWLVAGAAIVGVVMCFVPRHGVWMGLVVIVVGVIALMLTWPQPDGGRPPWSRGLRRLAVAWSVILVIGCLWELAQFVLGRVAPQSRWFALSEIVDPVVASVPGHLLFVAAWVAAGVFLIGRGRPS